MSFSSAAIQIQKVQANTFALTLEQQAFIDRLLKDQAGSRILETIVRTVSDETIRSLFIKYFKENLFDLALDPAANFVVQRMLERLTEPEDVSFCLHNLIDTYIDNLVSMFLVTNVSNDRIFKNFYYRCIVGCVY